jgi:hypothetical protein
MAKIKTDITSTSAPAPEQISIGELAFNAVTGILYAKMVDGTVIKFLGSPVCEDSDEPVCYIPSPKITVSGSSDFCCNGGTLTFVIDNLLVNRQYSYILKDLKANSTVVINEAQGDLLPNNSSQRTFTTSMNISSSEPKAVFKFSVYEKATVNGVVTTYLRSEKIIPICCQNCAG